MSGNLAQWSAIVAFFVPLVVAVLTKQSWPSHVKALMFFIVSLVAAGGTAWFQGDLTGKRFVDAALVVVAAAAAYYHGLWKPTEVTTKLEESIGVK